MATCSICNDGKRLTAHGLKIHMGKLHGVHYGDVGEQNTQTHSGLIPCPHPFCKKSFPPDQMRAHWESEHDTWKMHDGRFVWEVVGA
jgi:hypothetical protein